MGNYIKMIGVLVGICLVSGLALGGLNKLTEDKIENNILERKQIPSVIEISEAFLGQLDDAQKVQLKDDFLANKIPMTIDGEELYLFVSNKDDKPYMVSYERQGEGGYGGNIGIMVGINLETGDLVGMGVTTSAETPGVGSKVAEPWFKAKFNGLSKDTIFKVKKDGGDLDAISGATLSSRAVANGLEKAMTLYKEKQQEIKSTIEQ